MGMIDGHDECEWVNVSSGTSSPGLSRTKSTEPYYSCVCVCVSCCVLYIIASHSRVILSIMGVTEDNKREILT